MCDMVVNLSDDAGCFHRPGWRGSVFSPLPWWERARERGIRHVTTRQHDFPRPPTAQKLNGHKFRRQVPFERYLVDFVCFEARLIVEVDGGQHTDQQPYDTQRTAWLEAQGFRVLRFWNAEVLGNVGAVKEVIARACEREAPSP